MGPAGNFAKAERHRRADIDDGRVHMRITPHGAAMAARLGVLLVVLEVEVRSGVWRVPSGASVL